MSLSTTATAPGGEPFASPMSLDAKRVGRVVGVLLITQLVAGVLVNMVLMRPVITTPPGWLVNAAANARQVGFIALIALAVDLLTLGIAITAYPIFARHSQRLALWFVSLATASFALVAVESMTVMSMLSLSQAYANAGAPDAVLFEALRVVVGSARNWAHFTHLAVGGSTVFVLYAALYRLALVPRVLAALGMAVAVMQMIAVTMPFHGRPVAFAMLMPLAVTHLALALWLMTKGFETRRA